MKDWWQQLNSREQLFVSAGGVISFILLFYLLLWSPFTTNLDNLKSNVMSQNNLLHWMLPAQQQLLQLQDSGKKLELVDSGNLLIIIDSSLQQAQLSSYTESIQQISPNRVLVKFKSMPFNAFINWISSLWSSHQIKITEISIKPSANHNGIVSGVVYLS